MSRRLAALGIKFTVVLLVILPAAAQDRDDVAMRAMKDELRRSISSLQLQKMDKPYFMAYRMDDLDGVRVSASLGSLTAEQPSHVRLIEVELRVGDYALDNTNYLSAASFSGGMGGMTSSIRQAPLDDNYSQIRRGFWLATDTQYKKALEQISAKRAAIQMQQHTDNIPDFTKEPSVVEIQQPQKVQVGVEELKRLARAVSAVFKLYPDIHSSSVDIDHHDDYTRYLNSETSEFTRSHSVIRLQINAETQASDGLPISDFIEVYARTAADLPSTDILITRTRDMAERILKTRSASSVERYNGPVLFEPGAAGEIFAQQFATGLMAVRTPLSDDSRFETFFSQIMGRLGGESLADKIGGRVLPDFINVSDNPLLPEYKGVELLGWNSIDDDAVPTRETKLIVRGVLKTLLATRVPVRAIPHSTGSRRGWGASPSNLFVTSEKSSTDTELHQELLRRVKDRALDYGVLVRHVGAGTAASLTKMANRLAQGGGESGTSLAEAYKVFPDGHEELIQGAEISEMTRAAFKDIVAVGNTQCVHTEEFIPRLLGLFSSGISGSTDMPVVSIVTPAMLFDEVTIVKSQGPYPSLPISPSPLALK